MTTKYLIFAAALAVVGLIGWLLALQARETVEELEAKLKDEKEKRAMLGKSVEGTAEDFAALIEARDNANKLLDNARSDNEILRKELKEVKDKLLDAEDDAAAKGRQLEEERRQTGIWKGATSVVTRMALKEITADKTARPTPAERRPAAVPAPDPGRVVIIRGAVPVKGGSTWKA